MFGCQPFMVLNVAQEVLYVNYHLLWLKQMCK